MYIYTYVNMYIYTYNNTESDHLGQPLYNKLNMPERISATLCKVISCKLFETIGMLCAAPGQPQSDLTTPIPLSHLAGNHEKPLKTLGFAMVRSDDP